MKARPPSPERLLGSRLASNRNREERIERARQLMENAERRANALPTSFSNRGDRAMDQPVALPPQIPL